MRLLLAVAVCLGLYSTLAVGLTEQQVIDAAAAFSANIASYARDVLQTSAIQDVFDNANYFTNPVDGDSLADDLRNDMETLTALKLSALTTLQSTIETQYLDHTTESANCGGFYNMGDGTTPTNVPDLEHSDHFGQPVNVGLSGVKLAPGVIDDVEDFDIARDICLTKSLNDDFINNRVADPNLAWQYFGTQNGVFRMYPAVEWGSDGGVYTDYDPRLRPWYIASSSGPKDVVIILDVSGSMGWSVGNGDSANCKASNRGKRLCVAQDAVATLLGSLTPSDYVNVVKFSSDADVVTSCLDDRLYRATPTVIDQLTTDTYNTNPGGATDFVDAFSKAFDLFDGTIATGKTSNCQRTILFLTDGDSPYNPSDLIATRNAGVNARVFSYSFGDDISQTAKDLLLSISCANNGIYDDIPDNGDLRGQMSEYFQLYAAGITVTTEVWSPLYYDASGLGVMTTAAIPCYDYTDPQSPLFVGVAGVDIPISELTDLVYNFGDEGLSYAFMVNADGEALTHPNLPSSGEWDEAPVYIDINDLETSTGFLNNVRDQMLVADASGLYATTIDVILPVGDIKYEGTRVQSLEVTYFYRQVSGSPFSLAYVLTDEDADGNVLSSSNTGVAESYYHQISLYPESYQSEMGVETYAYGAEQYAGLTIALNTSTVKLAPKSFVNANDYIFLQEDSDTVVDYHLDLNDLPGAPNMGIKTQVEVEARLTTRFQDAWIQSYNESNIGVVWQYFGSRRGLFRTFPGHNSTKDYDPTRRPWFDRAMTYTGSVAVSTPYLDSGGAGKVVTLSKAIHTGSTPSPHAPSDPVAGVAGLDFSYDAFEQAVGDAGCVNSGSSKCWVIDSSGYFVTYDGFDTATDPNEYSNVFVGDVEPTLLAVLETVGFLTVSPSVDYDDFLSCDVYEADAGLVSVGSAVGGSLTGCHYGENWYLTPINGTNMYLVHINSFGTASSCTPDPVTCTSIIPDACDGAEDYEAPCPPFSLSNAEVEALRPNLFKCDSDPVYTATFTTSTLSCEDCGSQYCCEWEGSCDYGRGVCVPYEDESSATAVSVSIATVVAALVAVMF